MSKRLEEYSKLLLDAYELLRRDERPQAREWIASFQEFTRLVIERAVDEAEADARAEHQNADPPTVEVEHGCPVGLVGVVTTSAGSMTVERSCDCPDPFRNGHAPQCPLCPEDNS